MRSIRRRLSWLIAGWLVCQTASLTAAPVEAMFGLDVDPCCRGLGPGQTCPMHHAREGDRTCKMRNACPRVDLALVSLAGGLGVLPRATEVVIVFEPGDPPGRLELSALSRAIRPESPPPRA